MCNARESGLGPGSLIFYQKISYNKINDEIIINAKQF
jgi:hypothetical protein